MAATRYLVEGERLDVLIGQVKRMGRRVTVLKAEKVRKGGIAGFGGKEHYEILVEVEGVGEPPESFQNATKNPGVGSSSTPAKPAKRPEHRTLSEISDQAGIPKRAAAEPKASTPAAAASTPATSTPNTATDSGLAGLEGGLGAGGLQSLLDEARSQLNSNTEAAAADLEAQLAQLGLAEPKPNPAPTLAPVTSTPAPNVASAPNPDSGPRLGPVIDARLQGVAAPGAAAGVPRPAPAPVPPPRGLHLPLQAATDLGFPVELAASLAGPDNEISLEGLIEELPEAVEPLQKPGATIVVVGASPIALSVVETAQRLAGRIGEDAYCVLGGPKTTLPGEAPRARSGDELRALMEAHPGRTCVLALADSLIEAHRRTMAKLLSVIYIDQTWAVVDGRQPVDKIQSWLRGLPDTLHPDALAVQRMWEVEAPGSLFNLGVPIGMFDGVPARGEAWKMLLEDLLT